MNRDKWHSNTRNKSKQKPTGVILPPMSLGKNLELNNLKTIGAGHEIASRNTPLAGPDRLFPRSAKNALSPVSSINPQGQQVSSTPRSPKQALKSGSSYISDHNRLRPLHSQQRRQTDRPLFADNKTATANRSPCTLGTAFIAYCTQALALNAKCTSEFAFSEG